MLAETIIKITEFINEHNVEKEDIQELADMLDIRICDNCGELMYAGYYSEIGYACSDNCREKLYTEEEYEEMYKKDEAYWTEWI